MTRGPLNKLFHRAVQCRDQPVVTRLNDHGYPNKVSMKKKEKGEEGPGEINLYIPPRQGGGIKRDDICTVCIICKHIKQPIPHTKI